MLSNNTERGKSAVCIFSWGGYFVSVAVTKGRDNFFLQAKDEIVLARLKVCILEIEWRF